MRRLAVTALALVLSASAVQAAPAQRPEQTPGQNNVQTVLTPDSTLYAIEGTREQVSLELSRRRADTLDTLLVPGTDDEAMDSDARLLYDNASSTLFVVWHKADAVQDSIVLASLDTEGVWSEPIVLASCSSMRRAGLQTVLTRASDVDSGAQGTLIHAAWWGVGSELTAEYALVAFEEGVHVSTDVSKLNEIAQGHKAEGADEYEDTGAALHPPLAIARGESNAIDVVYGAANSTKVTRVRIDPRRVKGDARLWKPVGRTSNRTPRSRMVTSDASAVQAFISKGRVVLYRPDEKFRFVVFENGAWSPERMIQLDENLSSEELLRELRATVDELGATDEPAQQ
jgi:hypothetical protein